MLDRHLALGDDRVGTLADHLAHQRRADGARRHRIGADADRAVLDRDVAGQRVDARLRDVVCGPHVEGRAAMHRRDVDDRTGVAMTDPGRDRFRRSPEMRHQIDLHDLLDLGLLRLVQIAHQGDADIVDPSFEGSKSLRLLACGGQHRALGSIAGDDVVVRAERCRRSTPLPRRSIRCRRRAIRRRQDEARSHARCPTRNPSRRRFFQP